MNTKPQKLANGAALDASAETGSTGKIVIAEGAAAAAIEIPEGYIQIANGDLVPRHKIRESDWLRDAVANDLGTIAIEASKVLATFKTKALNDCADLVKIAFEKYGAKLGGDKGNLDIKSVCGKFKITRKISSNVTFTEEIHAAKALVDECLIRWIDEGANQNLIIVVNNAFKTNKKGHLSKDKIFEMLRWNIENDKQWDKAMQAISDSILTDGSTTYINAYQRNDKGDYIAIPLSLAGV